MSEVEDRSIPELFSAVSEDIAQLVRAEAQLLRAEMSEKASEATRIALAMGAGLVVVLGAYLCLLAALVLWLSAYMAAGWAALVVAAATGLIGATLVTGAAKKARSETLKPRRSVESLRRDAELVKEHAR